MLELSRGQLAGSDSPPLRKRYFAGMVAIVIGMVGLLVPVAAVPAFAEASPTGTMIRSDNTFYAYVGAGETLDVSFVQEAPVGFAASTVTVQRPGGAPETCAVPITATLGYACEWDDLTAATPGIWAVTYTAARYMTWEINVQRDGVDISGRVWVDSYSMGQRAVAGTDILQGEDFTFYYQAVTGDQYRATYFDFNGIDSVFSANAIGLRQPPACEPVYQSSQNNGPYADGLRGVTDDCGESYKIFFDEPAADLPTSATRFDGVDEWILNPVVDPTLSDIAFAPTSGATQSGEITFDVDNFVGTMAIQIDANGNNSYDDPEDLTIPYTPIDGVGTYTFDGLDGLGNPIPANQAINVRAVIDRTGEIHFVNADVELRGGGIEVFSNRGPDAGNTTVYWDDTRLNENQAERCTGPLDAVSALDGVDSTGGVHGWTDCGATPSNANNGINGSYGDTRYIQEWTYREVNAVVDVPVPARVPEIVVTKSADPASGATVLPGQVVNYTLTFENTGDADGVVDYDDVIEGVLDDATITAPPTASDPALTVSAITDDGRFTVDGTLTAGQVVSVTYAATVNANGERGDSSLGNFVVPGGEEPPTVCVEGAALCTEHFVPQLEIAKSSDADQDTRVGDTVTYTVTATNVGGLAYTEANPAYLTDDLTGVLDDAEYNGDAEASLDGDVSYAAPKLSWNGALGLGETVSLTYTATVVAGGDGVARNIAYNGTPETPTPVCDPPSADGTDPVTGIACAEDEFELPRLTIAKTSDVTDLPADGGAVTYTVTVTNVGPGAFTEDAPAVSTDDLSEVLDDAEFGSITAPTDGSAVFDADAETLTWSGPLAIGASATITYTVTYDSSTGDNILFNVACVPADDAAPGADNCAQVRIPAAELVVTKSVDPVSESAVDAGQIVTYTLSFDSIGEAAAAVDKVDDLSDVLDDATFVEGSLVVSNEALTATRDGDALTVTGSVPAGEVYTVSYSVTVNAYADQDNHILANVVQNPDGTCGPEDCPETNNPIRHFNVTKSATPTEGVLPGDTVEYTVTVTNDGEADYTAEIPAGITDDMSDVLDDASYDGNAVAVASDGSDVPAPTFAAPVLGWSGPLAVGESVEITYSVVVTNQGDADLINTATPVCAVGVICDPETPEVEVFVPRITPTKASDPATGSDVVAGQVVNYTLTFTNDGTATGVVDATDDLSDVLDDAELTVEPTTDVEGVTAVFDAEAQTIRIEGDLAAGATVTVTYQVTVRADGERGDNISRNIVTPDTPPYVCVEGDEDCDPFVPPTTEHFIGELDDWKTVDPTSGATVRAGDVMTYTLHFENTGEAPVVVDREDVLTQVLDDAAVTSTPVSSDAALAVTEITDARFGVSGSLEPGQVVTVTYQVTVNADGERGDDRLGNFLVNTGDEPPTECVPTDDERADCTVNHVSDVVVTKSADPESGTEVEQGQRVEYTLTFRNVSTNPAAEAASIDYTDHMADVLDDAALTEEPVSSDAAVTSTVAGDTIRVVGAVAAGETVTVTYAVTVNAYTEQGDHQLGNVVAVTGEEPVCAPDSSLCTSHELNEPDPLAITGVDIAWGALAGGLLLLLLLGGGAVFLARSRRETADSLTP